MVCSSLCKRPSAPGHDHNDDIVCVKEAHLSVLGCTLTCHARPKISSDQGARHPGCLALDLTSKGA
eukprot:110261-Pelagomonas_calceolata.AAC.1